MPALMTEQVLLEEARAIHGKDATGKYKVDKALSPGSVKAIESGAAVDAAVTADLYRALGSLNSAALCLSGGGIRSASFSLGVIQALASHSRRSGDDKTAANCVLAKFDYLSTVSGGGYIGSWFTAWVKRFGFEAVRNDLVGHRKKPEAEPSQISWLRSYSNFLTPKLGILSADTWAALALVLRNLILNWLVVLPALVALLVGLKLFAGAVFGFSQFNPQACTPWMLEMGLLGIVFLIVSLIFTTLHRPTSGKSHATQKWVLIGDLLPALAAGFIFTFALASPCAEVFVRQNLTFPLIPLPLLPGLIVVGMIVYAIAWVPAVVLRWRRGKRDFFGDLAAWIVAGGVYGALIAAGVYLYIIEIPFLGKGIFQPKETLLLVLGVPWALTAQLLAEMVFVGLTSLEDGSDADREWLARAAGSFMLAAIGWAVFMFLVFIGSHLVGSAYAQLRAWLVAGGAGSIVAFLGKSSATPAKGKAADRKQFLANIGLAMAGPLFLAALVIALSALIDQVLFGMTIFETGDFKRKVVVSGFPTWPLFWPLALAGVLSIVLGAVTSKFVNINRFSLHALYRNRLVRAFLGASNEKRDEDRNPFTDFAESDNPRMATLWPDNPPWSGQREKSKAIKPPFHIINIALNIVSSDKLAWQERKAEAFTVSPLHSGGFRVGYRPTKDYAHETEGISIGTAMAISGAAASPNMGYHSSPSLAILLTLFNVRLGWWLGNPGNAGEQTYPYEGPTKALKPLLWEMFGQTTDDHPYVYLSDGGHFENLGLYEMVRRRCRFIVVVDAGCDPKFEFEDLGNAARKIWLDLGVDITFRGLGALRNRSRKNFPYQDDEPPFHAIGTIHYSNADYGEPDHSDRDGTILYIKPAFHRARLQDVGVANYATCNPAFPHEPTSDQFFSESQFESYRALGLDITDGIFKVAFTAQKADLPENPTLPQIFASIAKTIRDFPSSESSLVRKDT